MDGSASITKMHEMLNKYTCDFPPHEASSGSPQNPLPSEDTILITGTTGGLGCALLVQLVNMPDVHKIYAVNRKGVLPLIERQREALADKGYDTDSVINSLKVTFVETDLAQDMLGLPQSIYDEVCQVFDFLTSTR
jgi:nucleoside-diphosphate-sugar epimerase